MPIITPAYPSMCATHNITLSTKTIIIREWKRAEKIIIDIMEGRKQWIDFFGGHTFFTLDYKHYLAIVASSREKDALLRWSGLVEARIRLLIGYLEAMELILVAHPFAKSTDRVHHCKSEEEERKVIDGELQYEEGATESVNLVEEVMHDNAVAKAENGDSTAAEASEKPATADTRTVYTTTFYIGLEFDPAAARKFDITKQTSDFTKICESWPTFDADLHRLSIIHMRNYELPLDVFKDGEVRPVKPVKNKVKIKKRKALDADLNDNASDASRQRLTPQPGNGTLNQMPQQNTVPA
jgi:poly(A) polymerase